MKLISFSNIPYLISLALHMAVLMAFIAASYAPTAARRSFQASVHFETPPDQKSTNRSSERVTSPRKTINGVPLTKTRQLIQRKKLTIPEPKLFKSPSLKKYITTPGSKPLQNTEQSGYLRANRRTKKSVAPLTPVARPPNNQPQGNISDQDLSGSPVPGKNDRNKQMTVPKTPSPIYDEEASAGETKSKGKGSFIWQKKSELLIYRNSLAKLVTANWIVPQTSVKQFKILIEAHIDRQGNLVSITLIKGSGFAVLDAAAERAIRVSTPFPEFPKSFNESQASYPAVFRFTPDRVAN
jgi:TonB family protein